jgi:hypothetical protein
MLNLASPRYATLVRIDCMLCIQITVTRMGEVIHVVQLKFKSEVDIAKMNEVCLFSYPFSNLVINVNR